MVHRELGQGGWTEWLYWLLRRRQHLVVRGDSMRPTLAPGDHVLMDAKAYRDRAPTVGDVVVAQHPFERGRKLIKRITAVDERGHCFLSGDNPEASTDSHAIGTLHPELILGRVTRRIP